MSFRKLSKFCAILAVLLLSSALGKRVLASPPPKVETGCFALHLKEAIALNKKRRPLYSALTDGKSEKISNTLIRYERLATIAAWYYDWRAKKFQKEGIPILCDEFVSMSQVPEFQSSVDLYKQDLEEPVRLNTSQISKEIREAYKRKGFEGVRRHLDSYLDELEEAGPYHCMVKHILESIWKAAVLASEHHAATLAAYLPSTENLSWGFIELQLLSLSRGDQLDADAFPIQTPGVPIICQDVPRIRILKKHY